MSRTRRPLGRGETGTRTLSRNGRRKVETELRGEGVEPQRKKSLVERSVLSDHRLSGDCYHLH